MEQKGQFPHYLLVPPPVSSIITLCSCGASVIIITEPILTHHQSLKSTLLVRFIFCIGLSMGFDECVMTRTYRYSVIQKMFSWP